MIKELNLKYVGEVIGEDYLNWSLADAVLIDSQCSTGKTTFVLNKLLEKGKKMLYLYNRKKLGRDIKRSFLKKEGKLTQKQIDALDLVELDKQKQFGDVKFLSYQALSKCIDKIDFDDYHYIILDEFHYIMSDSSFNNKTHIILNEFLLKKHNNSIKIFITATPEEVDYMIEQSKCYENFYRYDTGRDFSYLDTRYFKKNDDLLQLIKNDKSDEKWLIFVSSKKIGKEFEDVLLDAGVDAKFVHAGSKEEVIKNEKFTFKVLIATKYIDNGINIKDITVKNLVVMAWDKTTFIQEIGRLRFESIKKAYIIKLYIPTFKMSSFSTKINFEYKRYLKMVGLYKKNKKQFHEKYHMDHDKVPAQLFLLDKETNGWMPNLVGQRRLKIDYKFAKEMVSKYKEDEFAYVKEQLKWIDQEFDDSKLIQKVIDDTEVDKLYQYLLSVCSNEDRTIKLFANEQEKLSNLILNEFKLGSKFDYRTRKLKPMSLDILIRIEFNLPFVISQPKQESKGENRSKRYITIRKL